MRAPDIFTYITQSEEAYKHGIQINDVWNWSMREHIEDREIYKNSQIRGNKKKNTVSEVPVKNIMRPILNVKYRAEDIDVKDIILYVDDPDLFHVSLLVKKYHDDVYVIENDLDTFFDKVKESKIDLGGGLAKVINGVPEYVPLESIAFCHQKDMLNAPIGILHQYSPAQLKEFEKIGWGKTGATCTVDDLIQIYANDKGDIPGPDIPVYEVQGVLPTEYLDDEKLQKDEYVQQMQLISFFKDDKGNRQGLILFRSQMDKSPFKMATTEEIYNRSLGWGGIEELMEPQIWTTYNEIVKKDFLDSASKTILVTNDEIVVATHPNGAKNMSNLEFLHIQDNKDVKALDTYPRNIALFDKAASDWQEHAQRLGSAADPLLGENSPSGTPFRSQERSVIEGKGIHEYRRGKYAKWIEEVYKDWIIPAISKKITKGVKFLSELSLEEMQFIAESMANKEAKKLVNKTILAGKMINQREVDDFKQIFKESFMKGGNKRFIEILADELKNAPLKVKVNVKGKQKDLGLMADKITNIFRQIFANPQGFMQVMAIPGAAKSFNQMLEYSGMNPMDFSWVNAPQQIQQNNQTQTNKPAPQPAMAQ